jgi:hypothetical protein
MIFVRKISPWKKGDCKKAKKEDYRLPHTYLIGE